MFLPPSHTFSFSHIYNTILSSYKEISGLANNDLGKMMMIKLTTPQNQSMECLHKDIQTIYLFIQSCQLGD